MCVEIIRCEDRRGYSRDIYDIAEIVSETGIFYIFPTSWNQLEIMREEEFNKSFVRI